MHKIYIDIISYKQFNIQWSTTDDTYTLGKRSALSLKDEASYTFASTASIVHGCSLNHVESLKDLIILHLYICFMLFIIRIDDPCVGIDFNIFALPIAVCTTHILSKNDTSVKPNTLSTAIWSKTKKLSRFSPRILLLSLARHISFLFFHPSSRFRRHLRAR